MRKDVNLRSFGTHDGAFHADEVSACALLLLFNLIDKDKIVRSRNLSILRKCEYVCDVGGVYDKADKLFDHHQAEYTGKMSSAGMILDYLKGERIISEELYHYFSDDVIKSVDAYDTGYTKSKEGGCAFSQIVANFLPIEYDAPPEMKGKAFYEALDFVLSYFDRLNKRFFYIQKCKDIVKEEMEKQDLCLIFDKPIPWMENFFMLGGESHPAIFVIMPTGEGWKLRGIPPNLENRMAVRLPLPLKWGGLTGEELEKVSKIDGAVFCHKGRFISIWKSKDAALMALKVVLQGVKK